MLLRSPPRIFFSSPVFKCAHSHSSSPTPCISPPPVNEEQQPKKNNEDRNRYRKSDKSSKTVTARTLARLINKQPWSPELETSLTPFSSHLSKTTVLQSLRLIQTPDKSLKFFNWSTNQGFIHNEQTYYVLIETLGRSGNLNAARNLIFSIEKKSKGNVKLQDKFFNSLIRSYAEAGLFQEALKVFPTMKSIGISPSVITFNSLLSVLLRRGRTVMAKKLYEEMLFTGGASPDLYTFNILIRGFCMNSMVDDGFRVFKEMPRLGCEPDVITYNTLIDGLCRAGKIRIAHNLLKGMSRKSSDLNPNVVSYTTLIRGYCKKQEISEALEVFEEMISCGLRPNDITYNTLIQGLCEAQMIDKMKEILEGAIKVGSFVPDTCTFNTMMNSQCNAGKLEDALKVFEKFSELKVQPDSASYSILIRSMCQKREFERAEKLIDELLEKEILLRDDGCKRIVAAYNPILGYLCEKGRTRKADKLFNQLLRRGTHDPLSFKTLIMGHCKEGTFEGGFNLLVLMLRRDLVPDLEIYESLLDGFLKKNESAFAHKTLEKMLKSSYQPNTSTFHTVLMELVKAGSAQEAASLTKLMLDKRIRQNINISTDALILFFKSGLKDTAFEIVGLLYENGYSIKMDELIGFLCEKKKFPEAREIVLFCLEKNESIDVEVYSSVITGLCKAKQAAEAFSLYYESTEKGSHPSLSCLEDLKMTLESEGKSNEAEFVSKRLERSMNQEKK